ncbi:MAG: hypothetical protein A2X94_08495, partial [Bdellovibrionales bacterium GWB1_55_8]
MTDEEIFEKAFKKKSESVSAEIMMPVFYENQERPLGFVKTRVSTNAADLNVESAPVLSYLERFSNPDAFRRLMIKGSELVTLSAEATEWVTLSFFEGRGYKIDYNDKKLELRIRIPAEMRKTQYISLGGNYEDYNTQEVSMKPAFLSGYINLHGNQDFQFGDSTWGSGRLPLRAQMDSGLRTGPILLESAASYTETDPGYPSWTRGDIRLVHDSVGPALRETVGDLSIPYTGFQSPVQMGGVSVVSHFGLQPTRLTVPTGNYELFLKRSSKVIIYNNERLVTELDLPAGRHNLRDLAFSGGMNDTRLEITDDLGQTETVNMSYFYSSELMGEGLHQVAYAIGAPSIQSGARRLYRTDLVTGSGYHRYGFSKNLTLGANLQIDPSRYLAGLAATLSTTLGIFKFDSAMSSNEHDPNGYAFRGKYYYLDTAGPNKSQRTFGLGLDAKSPYFSAMANLYEPNPTAFDVSATYGQAISEKDSLSGTVAYQFNRSIRPELSNSFRVGLNTSRRWTSAINTSIMYDQIVSATGQNQSSFLLLFIWNLSKERQMINATYGFKDDSLRTNWGYHSAHNGAGSHSARIGIKRSEIERGFEGQGQYTGNRGIVTLLNSTIKRVDNPNSSTLTALQLGTSLVYAGGQFALGRPVTDSFALVSANKNLSNQTIEINPRKDQTYTAAADWLGPAVVPDLSSYNFNPLIIGTQNLKFGTAPLQDRFNLLPTYRSGYAIHLGSDPTTSLSVSLFRADGSPFQLQPGKIRSLEASDFAEITFFTGRTGKTRIDGLKAGKYE